MIKYYILIFSNQKLRMANLFYQIFNKQVELTPDLVQSFLKDAETLYSKFIVDNDIDNLKVLKNKIDHLLEWKVKWKNKKDLKEYEPINLFLSKIDAFLEQKQKEIKKVQLVDVVAEIDKDYKKCADLKEEDKDKYWKYCIKKSKIEYEKELIQLQVELLKLQNHIKEAWLKMLIIFEWRDAAWKWGTIKRFREYLNPRWARLVALEKPTDLEKSQWYFQRYIPHLPSWWEMVFFDRSRYNRAWVEPVMWFVGKKEYEQFLKDVPAFEKMLVESWVMVVKFYFSVSKEEQKLRFESREFNPLKQYKLSPIDQYSQQLWDKYSLAEYYNFKNTHTDWAPWIIIRSDNKKKARINAIKYVLNLVDYPEKVDKEFLKLDKKVVMSAKEKLKWLEKEDPVDTSKDLFE